MNLESRVAKLEARRSTRRVVWCEPGGSAEQADEAICIRWLDDAEAAPEPAPVPPPVVPEPVVTPPPVVPEPPSRPVHPERPRPTHPTVPTRSPTAAGWT